MPEGYAGTRATQEDLDAGAAMTSVADSAARTTGKPKRKPLIVGAAVSAAAVAVVAFALVGGFNDKPAEARPVASVASSDGKDSDDASKTLTDSQNAQGSVLAASTSEPADTQDSAPAPVAVSRTVVRTAQSPSLTPAPAPSPAPAVNPQPTEQQPEPDTTGTQPSATDPKNDANEGSKPVCIPEDPDCPDGNATTGENTSGTQSEPQL